MTQLFNSLSKESQLQAVTSSFYKKDFVDNLSALSQEEFDAEINKMAKSKKTSGLEFYNDMSILEIEDYLVSKYEKDQKYFELSQAERVNVLKKNAVLRAVHEGEFEVDDLLLLV